MSILIYNRFTIDIPRLSFRLLELYLNLNFAFEDYFRNLGYPLSSIGSFSQYWLSYLGSFVLLHPSTCLLNVPFLGLSLWLLITSLIVLNFLSTYQFAHIKKSRKLFYLSLVYSVGMKLFCLFNSKCNV